MTMQTATPSAKAEAQKDPWAELPVIRTAEDYIQSLRGRKLKVHLFGEIVAEPVDHPMIRPSINALAATYKLATDAPELATAESKIAGKRVNRFLHIVESPEDLVMKNKMQRKLGQVTGTCFQRCAGLDTLSVLHSVTYDIDQKHKTPYHSRYLTFLKQAQEKNVIVAAAMTDPKGDRSLSPVDQADPDMFLHVVKRTEQGVYVRGAKSHTTGGINSHWICVMPTMRLDARNKDYAIVGMIPATAPGITYIYGRQSCDTRSMEGGSIDVGNCKYGGQEAMIIFEDVFIPHERIFMDGEFEFASELVERFTAYHRASYVCKTGLGDVMIGAAGAIAEMNGVADVSHIRDKLVEMTHLNETIYAAGIASSHQATKLPSGAYINDSMLSNVCKHNVTRFPYEISRIAQDLAGGIVVTLPSEKDFEDPTTGPLLKKFLKGKADVDTEARVRMLRLIENMTLGRNAVGYLTESMHGAGSPQAQRIQIARQMKLAEKKTMAKKLAGIDKPDGPGELE